MHTHLLAVWRMTYRSVIKAYKRVRFFATAPVGGNMPRRAYIALVMVASLILLLSPSDSLYSQEPTSTPESGEPANAIDLSGLPTTLSPDQTYPAITAANVSQIQALTRLGYGQITAVTSVRNTQILALAGTAGVWLVDIGARDSLPRLIGRSGSWIMCLAVSPDGKHILTGSADGAARLWDLNTGELLQTYSGHLGAILSVAFSPDGTKILTGSADKTMFRWDINNTSAPRIYRGHGAGVTAVGYSHDGKLIASGSRDTLVRIWDGTDNQAQLLFTLGTPTDGTAVPLNIAPTSFTTIAFSPDSSKLLMFNDQLGLNRPPSLWDTQTGQKITEFSLEDRIGAVAFSPDGSTVALGLRNRNSIVLVDANTGQTTATLEAVPNSRDIPSVGIVSVAYLPNGRRLLTRNWDDSVSFWDLRTGQLIEAFYGTGATSSALNFSEDGKHILISSKTNLWADDAALLTYAASSAVMHLWDVYSGQPDVTTFLGAYRAVYSPQGNYIAMSDEPYLQTHNAYFLNVTTNKTVRTFSGHDGSLTSIAFSKNGRYVLTASTDNTARVWDIRSNASILTLVGHTGLINSVAMSSNGNMILTGSEDGTAQLWRANNGESIRVIPVDVLGVTDAVFSPNGASLATASWSGVVELWNARTGASVRVFSGPIGSQTRVDFSPDGKLLLTSQGGDVVRLWNVNTGTLLASLPGTIAAFSPDGSLIVTGSNQGPLLLWGIPTQ